MFLLVLLFSLSLGKLIYAFVSLEFLCLTWLCSFVTMVSYCRERLLPIADIITPNVKEASALLGGFRIETVADMRSAAKLLHEMGPRFPFSLIPLYRLHLFF